MPITKEKKNNKEAKQNETTTTVPLRGMKIKKRASDDILVKNVRNVRSVRNRTIAACHKLYTQGETSRCATTPKPQLIRGCRNQKKGTYRKYR